VAPKRWTRVNLIKVLIISIESIEICSVRLYLDAYKPVNQVDVRGMYPETVTLSPDS